MLSADADGFTKTIRTMILKPGVLIQSGKVKQTHVASAEGNQGRPKRYEVTERLMVQTTAC